MEFIKTDIPGVMIVRSQVYSDRRGYFLETYHKEKFSAFGVSDEFVQDNFSRSSKGIVRGLHYQEPQPQGKLVRVTRGEIFDVAVDIRIGSPTFRKWVGISLRGDIPEQLWIPPGFAHGFQAVSEIAEVYYKVTHVWSPANDRVINWRDPDLGISWPIEAATLSDKDTAATSLAQASVLPHYAESQ